MSLKLVLLLMLLAITTSSSYNAAKPATHSMLQITELAKDVTSEEPKIRHKRGAFWDFIQKFVTTKNLIVDQYVDTKNTINQVYNMINDDFTDSGPPKPTFLPTTTTESTLKTNGNDDEIKTTTEKYRISKYEFGRILGRNFRGLKRLTDIEIKDALNQTQYNIIGYQQEARKQFANSKTLELKDKLKKG